MQKSSSHCNFGNHVLLLEVVARNALQLVTVLAPAVGATIGTGVIASKLTFWGGAPIAVTSDRHFPADPTTQTAMEPLACGSNGRGKSLLSVAFDHP